ncbi:MAG: DUF4062 domain-containing protein [Acidobacteriota bacterium]
MDRRYQVFISSTYEDLKSERNEVVRAMLELDCIPCGMEYFPAASEDQWSYIKDLIRACDYYVVIVAGRYGSISSKGVSYTQMEYEFALDQGIPCIAFLHRAPEDLPARNSEADPQAREQLDAFRSKLRTRLCKEWTSAHELGAFVSRSLTQLMKSQPRVGWVRADSISSEESTRQLLQLTQKVSALEEENKLLRGANISLGDLAQGADTLRFDCEYTLEVHREGLWKPERIGTQTRQIETTWDELFRNLLPRIHEEASESAVKRHLGHFALVSLPQGVHDQARPAQVGRAKVSAKTFDRIKVQALALGLVELTTEVRPGNKKATRLWRTTQRGIAKMYELLAQRSPKLRTCQ